MWKLILIVSLTTLFIGCSIVKIVNLPIQKTEKYKSLNPFQQDFLYLTALLEDNYPHFNEEVNFDIYQNKKAEILNRLSIVNNDNNFKIEIQRFLASFKNNHTKLGGVNSNATDIFASDSLFLPVKFHSYNKKWYILNIDANLDKNLLGSQVISIDDIKMESLDSLAWQFISAENNYALTYEIENRKIYQRPSFFTIADSGNNKQELTIEAIGPDGNRIKYKLNTKDPNQISWLKIERINPETEYKKDYGYYYELKPTDNLAYLQLNTFFDKPTLLYSAKGTLNPFVYPLLKILVNKQYKNGKYGSEGAIEEVKENTESFPRFLNEMFDSLFKSNIENLVIDLRYNSGGTKIYYSLLNFIETDSDLTDYTTEVKITPYLRKADKKGINSLKKTNHVKLKNDKVIIEKSRCGYDFCYNEKKFKKSPFYMETPKRKYKGEVYIITSPGSASAATVFPVILKDNKRATIVGMPPANRPSGPTMGDILAFPNTKIPFTFSISYMTRPDKSKNNERVLDVDKFIEYKPDDIYNGNDPIYEWIKQDIKSKNN